MMTEKELKVIEGGAVNWFLAGTIGGIIVFLSGFVDGLFRPLSCNK